MTHYPLDYIPETLHDCNEVLRYFRQQTRDALYMIEKARDPKYTPLAIEYIPVMQKLVASYAETINRIIKLKATKEKDSTCQSKSQ